MFEVRPFARLASLLIGVTILFGHCTVFADEEAAPPAANSIKPSVPEKLSLRQSVMMMARFNPEVKDLRLNYLTAKSGVASARDLGRTDVFASMSKQSVGGSNAESSASAGTQLAWNRPSGDSLSATITPVSTSNLTSTANLSYRRPVIRGSGGNSDTMVGIKNAQWSLASQENQLFMSYQQMTLQVVRNYFSAVRARDLIVVSESDVTIAKETVRMAKRKLEEGLVAEIELTQAQIQLAQSEDELVSRKRAYQDALDQLLLSMGLNVGQKPDLIDTVPQERKKVDADTLVQEALKNRKELQVADIGIERQKLELNVSRDELRPGIDIVGGYTKAGLGLGGSSYSSSDHWSAGLEYSLPLGSVSRRERKENAKRQLEQLGVQRDFQVEQIKNDVLAAVRSMEAADASLTILESNLTVAETNLKTAQRMVDEGLRPYRDLLDAQVSLTRTRSSLLASQIDYYMASMTLERALGRDLAQQLTGQQTTAQNLDKS